MAIRKMRRAQRPVAEKVEGSIEVRSSGYGIAQEDRRVIDVVPFESDPAYIKASVGITKKLEVDFEFLRLDVSITMPCYPEEVDEVFPRIRDKVEEVLEEELKRWGVES